MSTKDINKILPKTVIQKMAAYSADLLDPFVLRQKLTPLDIAKSVVLTVTLLPVRLLLMLIILLLAWTVGTAALARMTEEEAKGLVPLSGSRRRWAKPFVAKLARLMFVAGGWYWIPQRGRPRAPPSDAPILLAVPHSSFFDTVVVTALGCPGLVASDSTETIPFFGSLLRFMQPLYVRREDPDSRRQISHDIRQRVTSGQDWEQLLLFPEGGCGNRKALLSFKIGAFSPGVPVQPVFIRYKNKLDTITWTWDGPGVLKQVWLTLTQVRIGCELEFLPVYKPSKLEKENPRLFADNVQNFISSWTSTPASKLCLEDASSVKAARDRCLPATVALVKQFRLRRAVGRHSMEPVEELQLLEKSNNSSADQKGDIERLRRYLELDACPDALREYFRIIDQHGTGKMDMRVYDAGLHLMRTDIKAEEKIRLAFQVTALQLFLSLHARLY